MSNIMSKVKLNNKPNRSGFDLSRKNAFTAKVGELLPVACIEIIPGDFIEGEVQHFTRTQPVNSAAFTRIREYYDWFFVPTNLLWNKFNTFVSQMSRNNQHARDIVSNNHISDTHPYFTCQQLHNYVREVHSKDRKNVFGFKRSNLTCKLLNYLGYGDYSLSQQSGAPLTLYRENLNLNPFPLLAYQKIYADYFRNSQWEQAYAPAFNIDYMTGDNSTPLLDVATLYTYNQAHENMFDLRYCNWNKDKFMGLLSSPQYGQPASIIPSEFSVPSYFTSQSASLPETGYAHFSDEGEVLNGLGLKTLRDIANNRTRFVFTEEFNQRFSVLALRQAEALQKWKEITMSQQQDYKTQVEAHFGVSMSDAYSERCRYVHGSVSSLDISEVTNTNITGTNDAVIAGKGVGVGQSKFEFKSDVHGYLMCIYHAVPLLDYGLSGVSRVNTKTKVTDYAIPEFDSIGMVPVPTVELTNNVDSSVFAPKSLGYAPRYYDLKTAIDEVHGAFRGALSHWVAPIDDSYINSFLASVVDVGSLTPSFFKVNPSFLNPIFGQDADETLATDQLLVNSNFDIKAVRNLDRNGLPY